MNSKETTEAILEEYKKFDCQQMEREKLVDRWFPYTFNPSVGHSTLSFLRENDPKAFKQMHIVIPAVCIRDIDFARAPYDKRLTLFKMIAFFSARTKMGEAILQYINILRNLDLDTDKLIWTMWGGGILGTSLWNKYLPPDKESEEVLRELGFEHIYKNCSASNYLFPSIHRGIIYAGPRVEVFYELPNHEYIEVGTIQKIDHVVNKNDAGAPALIPLEEIGLNRFITIASGAERLEMAINGYREIWQTDSFKQYLTSLRSIVPYLDLFKQNVFDVIDKFRAISFALFDGANELPADDLRKKLLNRFAEVAIRRGQEIGYSDDNFWKLLYEQVATIEGEEFVGFAAKKDDCTNFMHGQRDAIMRWDPDSWF